MRRHPTAPVNGARINVATSRTDFTAPEADFAAPIRAAGFLSLEMTFGTWGLQELGQRLCPLLADSVAKVENRTTPKISQKLFLTTLQLQCSVVPIRRSVVAFLSNDVVSHVAARETHQRS